MSIISERRNIRKQMRNFYTAHDLENAVLYAERLIATYDNQYKEESYGYDAYNVGLIYDNLEQLNQATKFYTESAQTLKNSGYNKSPSNGLIFPLNNLSFVFMRLKNKHMAINFQTQTIRVAELLFGKNSYQFINSHYNLGNIYSEFEEYDKALNHLVFAETAIESLTPLDIEAFSGSLVENFHVLNSLGYVYEAIGDGLLALQSLEKGLEAMRKKYLSDDILDELCKNIYYLANVCSRFGFEKKARSYYEEALRIIKKTTTNAYYPSCLNNLATVQAKLYDVAASIALRLEAMYQIKSVVGYRTISLADCSKNISTLYRSIGNYEEACRLLKDSIEARKLLLGSDSLECMNDQLALLETYIEAQKTTEAHELFKSMLDTVSANPEQLDSIFPELAKLFTTFGDINSFNKMFSDSIFKPNQE